MRDRHLHTTQDITDLKALNAEEEGVRGRWEGLVVYRGTSMLS